MTEIHDNDIFGKQFFMLRAVSGSFTLNYCEI
jgi:hypothetical protein